MRLLRDRIKGFLFPTFSELSLFTMSLSFVLVFFFNEPVRSGLFKLMEEPGDKPTMIIVFVFFGAGLVLSLYHVFAKRKKTKIEKHAMLGFAVVSNAICGILASLHILGVSVGNFNIFAIFDIRDSISGANGSSGASRIFLILPIWNIINCVFLLMSLRSGLIDERNISDEKAGRFELLFGFLITVTIFIVCQFLFKLYWAITFSICVIYATSFSDALDSVFGAERQSISERYIVINRNAKMTGKSEICGLCGRVITPGETPYVINRKLIVCKECYDKIQGQG
jgi:hypothetical protein